MKAFSLKLRHYKYLRLASITLEGMTFGPRRRMQVFGVLWWAIALVSLLILIAARVSDCVSNGLLDNLVAIGLIFGGFGGLFILLVLLSSSSIFITSDERTFFKSTMSSRTRFRWIAAMAGIVVTLIAIGWMSLAATNGWWTEAPTKQCAFHVGYMINTDKHIAGFRCALKQEWLQLKRHESTGWAAFFSLPWVILGSIGLYLGAAKRDALSNEYES